MLLGNHEGRGVVVADGELLDIADLTGGAVGSDPMAFADLSALEIIRAASRGAGSAVSRFERAGATLGAPIPRPGKVLAVALNYRPHADEAGFEVPAVPALFARLPSAIAGPNDDIVLPDGRDQIDWEAELVLVVGREARHVSPADAWAYIAGVTAGQDISDRVAQFDGPSQFTMAKSYDTFAPIGPYMATLDEFEDTDAIGVSCVLNGDEVQQGNTKELIHDASALLAYTSAICTLNPGDLIFTGTPAGVGFARKPPRYLQAGDEVVIRIQGIGELRNPVIAES